MGFLNKTCVLPTGKGWVKCWAIHPLQLGQWLTGCERALCEVLWEHQIGSNGLRLEGDHGGLPGVGWASAVGLVGRRVHQQIKALAASFPPLPLGPSPLESPVHPARLPTLFITHRPEDKTKGLAVVIDARKKPPHPGLLSALQATQVSGRWTAPTSRSWEIQGTCDVHGAQGAQSWDQEPPAGTLNYRYRNPSPKRPEDREFIGSLDLTIWKLNPTLSLA